jgi:predicted enzyme related to lactoylglutathione lyase
MSSPENSPDPREPNSIEWNELITPDPEAAVQFYGDLFGWTTEKFPMGDFDYTMFKHGDKTFGGVMKPMQPGTPPLWLNYVSVTDVDASFAKAKSLGATPVAGPMDIGEAGKIAVFQDPQGALIGLHQAS